MRSILKRKNFFPVAVLLFLLLLVACAKVPITNRTQLILLPRAFEMQLGASAYLGMLESEKVSKNKHYAQTVTRVGQRIAAVSHTPNLRWRYTVFDNDKMVNAFALPGGKSGFTPG